MLYHSSIIGYPIGKCENMKLQMGYYFLKSNNFPIKTWVCDFVIREEWLQRLGHTIIYFKEYMIFNKDGCQHTSKVSKPIHQKSSYLIVRKKILNKGHFEFISPFNAP